MKGFLFGWGVITETLVCLVIPFNLSTALHGSFRAFALDPV